MAKTNQISTYNPETNQNITRLYKLFCVAKEAVATLDTKEKERIADELAGTYETRIICEALDLDRGTYYNHKNRSVGENIWYKKRHNEIAPLVKEIFHNSYGEYGADKIKAILQRKGYKKISKQYVLNIMREYGLRSQHAYSKTEKGKDSWNTRRTNEALKIHSVTAPNKLWTTDMCSFAYKPYGKVLYLCVFMDVYTREIVAYNIGRNASTHLTRKTFLDAYKARKPEAGLVVHSDNGSGYTSSLFKKSLDDCNCIHELSRAHTPKDNGAMESFFGKFKTGRFGQSNFNSERSFRNAVDDYIDNYNNNRPHEAFGNRLIPSEKAAEYYNKQRSKQQ